MAGTRGIDDSLNTFWDKNRINSRNFLNKPRTQKTLRIEYELLLPMILICLKVSTQLCVSECVYVHNNSYMVNEQQKRDNGHTCFEYLFEHMNECYC